MSDKLALSAALSVMLMTVYVLCGGDAARPAFDTVRLDMSAQAAAPSLRPLRVVLAEASARRILY